jgi:hypothetical protein
MEKTYFIGTGHHKDTVIFHLRRNLDALPCEIYNYYGERITTKKKVREQKDELLKAYNRQHLKSFTKIKID